LAAHLEAAANAAMPIAAAATANRDADGLATSEVHGGTSALVGVDLPAVTLPATDGSTIDLAALGAGRTVVYVYPLTDRPGLDLPEGWDNIPGARGCTADACGFRDHHGQLLDAGAAGVYGLSAQSSDYQRELVDRLRLPFAMLADPGFAVRDALGLPTFEAAGMTLYRRLTMIITDGAVEHVFYPVFRPDQHAEQVLDWLRAHPGGTR
jgi:peroxiredoxin